jgi:hypothetical protein
MTLLEDALGYGRRHRPVFPVDLDKRPLTSHGFKDATDDVRQIERWWVQHPDAGIGTPTGPNWFVLDDDTGGTAIAALEAEHGPLPPTIEVATPRPGRHVYLIGETTNSDTALPDGLNVRGRGGYVLLPPSPHRNGVYEWRTAPDETPIAPAPAWLLALLASSRRSGRLHERGPNEWDETPLIKAGKRHQALVEFAGHIRACGLSEECVVECGLAFLRHQTADNDPARPIDWQFAEGTLRDICDRYPPYPNRGD